eukprot:GHVR01006886.1.p1 GENE.GHVR01006886.1~~GHVR01006886.1.p1  ORF type:complete len:115 (-),score=13.57 GHVR01006886.1:144-488(-)
MADLKVSKHEEKDVVRLRIFDVGKYSLHHRMRAYGIEKGSGRMNFLPFVQYLVPLDDVLNGNFLARSNLSCFMDGSYFNWLLGWLGGFRDHKGEKAIEKEFYVRRQMGYMFNEK